eukprot:scaffold35060_cov22-Tisochrysis_lutea.AAC.1
MALLMLSQVTAFAPLLILDTLLCFSKLANDGIAHTVAGDCFCVVANMLWPLRISQSLPMMALLTVAGDRFCVPADIGHTAHRRTPSGLRTLLDSKCGGKGHVLQYCAMNKGALSVQCWGNDDLLGLHALRLCIQLKRQAVL